MATDKGSCGFEECDRLVVCKGLCNGHYTQQYKGQELRPLIKRHAPTGCTATGCGKRARMFSSGQPLCDAHNQRWLKYGDAEKMTRNLVTVLGTEAVYAAVADRDRSECWIDWHELPCWEGLNGWGGAYRNGYPYLGGVSAVMWVAMEADGRPRPAAPGNYGRHQCHNKACWNPAHLVWGTHEQNMTDNTGRMDYCRHCEHCNS